MPDARELPRRPVCPDCGCSYPNAECRTCVELETERERLALGLDMNQPQQPEQDDD